MKNSNFLFNMIFLLVFLPLLSMTNENSWQKKGLIHSTKPGLIKTNIPANLYFSPTEGYIDLDLIGPDQKPRSFKCYWQENIIPDSIKLKALTIKFISKNTFLWEGSCETKIPANKMIIDLKDYDFVCRVNIKGLSNTQWEDLVRDEAIYSTKGLKRQEINIKEGFYKKIRIEFFGYNQTYKEKFIPIENVFLTGNREEDDFIEESELNINVISTDKEKRIKTQLPGYGLLLDELSFLTEAQFQGEFEMGWTHIKNNKKKFNSIIQGNQNQLNENLKIRKKIGKPWFSNELIIILKTKGNYIGKISGLKVKVKVPKILFYADKEGNYYLRSGVGDKIKVLKNPGEDDSSTAEEHMINDIILNKEWKPESLVKKFGIKGAPFKSDGYKWFSKFILDHTGYIKLNLNRDLMCREKLAGLRIVKEGFQIPFLFGSTEINTTDISDDIKSTYSEENNQTELNIDTTEKCYHYSSINLYAKGLFKRRINIQMKKSNRMEWGNYDSMTWENNKESETELRIKLPIYKDGYKLKITLEHGDNQPIQINKIIASYYTTPLLFIAREQGEYRVYTGNQEAKDAEYDLSILRPYLLNQLPEEMEISKLEQLGSSGFWGKFRFIHKNKDILLYIILGFVSLILVFIIIKLFPKSQE